MRENCTECACVIDELAALQNSFERIVDGLPKGMWELSHICQWCTRIIINIVLLAFLIGAITFEFV